MGMTWSDMGFSVTQVAMLSPWCFDFVSWQKTQYSHWTMSYEQMLVIWRCLGSRCGNTITIYNQSHKTMQYYLECHTPRQGCKQPQWKSHQHQSQRNARDLVSSDFRALTYLQVAFGHQIRAADNENIFDQEISHFHWQSSLVRSECRGQVDDNLLYLGYFVWKPPCLGSFPVPLHCIEGRVWLV